MLQKIIPKVINYEKNVIIFYKNYCIIVKK